MGTLTEPPRPLFQNKWCITCTIYRNLTLRKTILFNIIWLGFLTLPKIWRQWHKNYFVMGFETRKPRELPSNLLSTSILVMELEYERLTGRNNGRRTYSLTKIRAPLSSVESQTKKVARRVQRKRFEPVNRVQKDLSPHVQWLIPPHHRNGNCNSEQWSHYTSVTNLNIFRRNDQEVSCDLGWDS